MKIPRHCQEKACSNFFAFFARFEYAMKVVGFRSRTDGQATPDWNALADVVRDYLNNNSRKKTKDAIDYLLTYPPKRQDVVNDLLQWVDIPANQGDRISDLFVYIRRVRNNLFHGGKFKGKYLAYPERSIELMEHCVTVLKACLDANDDLREAFEH